MNYIISGHLGPITSVTNYGQSVMSTQLFFCGFGWNQHILLSHNVGISLSV